MRKRLRDSFVERARIPQHYLMQPGKVLFFLILLAIPFLATSCLSPKKRVQRKHDELKLQWQTNIQNQARLKERVIDWPSAVSLMLENNLELRTSRNEITNSQAMVKQIWKDLIPNLNLRAGVTKRLTSLHTTTFDDVNFSADSFFNIPGIVNFSARLYTARLMLLRSQIAYRLAERRQMIELYRLFYGAEEADFQTGRLQTQRATASAMEQIDPFTGRMMQTELRTRELANVRELQNVQDRASKLLGSRDHRWVFATNNLPDLRYHEIPLELTDTNRVAGLQLKLFAVELEAARAQILGMKLRYWPELNIFISSPPLYSRQFGRERWWDADELRASADIFWTIDTRGQLTRLIRQTSRQIEFQKARYREENIELMNRLLFTQELIKSVQDQLQRVDRQLQLLLAVPPPQNYLSVQKYALDYRSLTQQQLRLRRELSELNTLFWFIDEEAWRTQMTAAPAPLNLDEL